MPIIVDKEQKKRDIALACKRLLVENHIHELTISQLAKEAGIGKGTFYEYFHSKEALLFTLVEILMAEYNALQEKRLEACVGTQEKIECFAGFFYEEDAKELRALYKMFVGISLLSPDEEMMAFQTECLGYYYSWFERLIEEGIEKGEIVPQSRELAKGLFAMAKGLFTITQTTHAINDMQSELERFTGTLFHFITVKKDADVPNT